MAVIAPKKFLRPSNSNDNTSHISCMVAINAFRAEKKIIEEKTRKHRESSSHVKWARKNFYHAKTKNVPCFHEIFFVIQQIETLIFSRFSCLFHLLVPKIFFLRFSLFFLTNIHCIPAKSVTALVVIAITFHGNHSKSFDLGNPKNEKLAKLHYSHCSRLQSQFSHKFWVVEFGKKPFLRDLSSTHSKCSHVRNTSYLRAVLLKS